MRGYTIVELLVVGAIIGILSTIVIVGQTTFTRTLLLSNTASDVALSLHNTQLFGIGSRTAGTKSNAGYGLDFSLSTPSSYIFFADLDPKPACTAPNCKPGNGYYTSSDTDSDLVTDTTQTYTLNNGMTVYNFCALIPSALPTPKSYCKTGGTNTTQHVSISFSRPYTLTTIAAGTIGSGATSVAGEGTFTEACITIASPQSTYRHIRVNQVGHITFATSCP